MSSKEPRTVALVPIRDIARVTNSMIVVTCAMGTLSTWAAWQHYRVTVGYLAGDPGIGVAEYVGADNTSENIAVLWLLAYLTTGVMFLTWSWRARCNAERLSPLPHRLTRGWTIAGWLVPLFPLIVLEDVWRTSRKDQPSDTHRTRDLPRAKLVHYWWWTMVACAATALWLTVRQHADPTVDALLDMAAITTVLALLEIAAAALAITLIRQITDWQTTR